jgi:hypothetical protein
MGSSRQHDRSCAQRALRQGRDERAFIFDKNLSRCLGEIARDQSETAISLCGGDVVSAARECGVAGVPRGARVLWGRSANDALDIYRRWQKRRPKR